MKLVAFHGPAQSGKDTGYQFLKEWADERGVLAVRRGFADMLKWSAARLFYPQIEMEDAVDLMNALKFDERRKITLGMPGGNAGSMFSPEPYPERPDVRITGRELLQRYGTESHRDIFGPDFWANALLPFGTRGLRGSEVPIWHDSFPDADIAVITDLRFENEARRILELDGQAWRIVRPGLDALPGGHISEAVLDDSLMTEVLDQHRNLDEYREHVRALCDKHLQTQDRT